MFKRRIAIKTGFKEFESAQRTLAGKEIINNIRKDQLSNSKKSWFATFKSLAAYNKLKSAKFTT